ncbi:GntR family transcriptional regulator [Candidatus Fermentibacteria bacterium]|nr:GntR family transcriptional regulator [Candidatus Fermentibacteria bacterium]
MNKRLDNCIIVLYTATMITIDLSSPTTVVDQLVQSLKEAVVTGAVSPGQPLPSARQLAGDLGVHWNTVARAYRHMADEGFVHVVRGRRAIVRQKTDWSAAARREARTMVLASLREAVAQSPRAGIDADELRALLSRELETQRGGSPR